MPKNHKLTYSLTRYIFVVHITSLFWLLRIISLPTENATARMRIWRASKTLGCASLRGGEPQRPHLADFQGKTSATRRDLWVDRLASAWLIRRFIDPQAQFLWLEDVTHCPPDALGFDFDGATFTHVGQYVTFETLLRSFGLEHDVGLQRLGTLLHTLDVGGTAPEAAGFALLLKGLKHRAADDDVLLSRGRQLLDDVYHAFSTLENVP